MRSRGTASRGALGGSSNERAAELRACVGAVLAAAVIRDESVIATGLQVVGPQRARLIRAEGDDPVDDLVVVLDDGSRLFVQVKLSVGLTKDPRKPLGKALAQFIRAVRGGLGPGDQLILASAVIPAGLRHLAAVLTREQLLDHGGRTASEQSAVDAFREAAERQGATDAEFAEICKRVTIWQTDPTTGDAAAALISRIDGAVSAVGKGAAGAHALADVIRELARRRGGLDAVGLVRALAVREIPLAEDSQSIGTVALARALDDYEDVVAKIGSTLRLIGVPGELGELPFERADAGIEVKVADEERAFNRELEHAFRRRGRVILEGDPGGGKSTALRTLGAIAATRDDWPVPVRVHLQHLATASGSLTKAVVAAATDDLSTREAGALATALERELAAGNVLLLLDGLDEVRRGRAALIERLLDWFDALQPGTEIVVATRPSAAPDAARLGFPVLRLQAPDHPDDLVDAILDAVQPESGDEAWVDTRRAWLDAAFRRDPQLVATPLSVAVLTLIAARSSEPSALPTGRAQLLKRALEDIVSRWELEYRQRGAAAVGPLDGSRAEEALMIAFRELGCTAVFAESLPRSEAEAQVRERLRDGFPLQSADSCAAARDAIRFWDEAGLISFDADALRLTLRPFGELAAAWDIALREEPERRTWVAEARLLEDLWQTLGLAAALTRDIAEEWAAAIERNGHEEELAALAGALRDGMHLSQQVVDAAATAAGERLLASPESIDRTAQILTAMPLSPDAQARLRPQLSARARPGRAVLIEALVTARWNEEGADARARLRAGISEGRAEPPDPPTEPGVFAIPERDSLYDSAYQAAAIRLASGPRADAELVTSSFKDGSFDFIQELGQGLRNGGHRDLADSITNKLTIGDEWTWRSENFKAAERRIIGWAATLARPADLDQRQRRGLDDFADLFESAALNWIRPTWAEKHAGLAREWIRIAAVLGGFDLGLIAGEALIVLDDLDRDRGTETLVYDNGRGKKLDRWDRLDGAPAALRHLVSMLGISSHQVTGRVGRAIAYAPNELGALPLLEERVEVLLHWSRWYVSRLILAITPDPNARATALAADSDPILRSIGAEYLAHRYLASNSAAGTEAFLLMNDPDENVREAAANGFATRRVNLDERTTKALRVLRDAPRQPWICRHCGAWNPPHPRAGCGKCSTVGPEVVSAVDSLLGDRERKPIRFARRRREFSLQ